MTTTARDTMNADELIRLKFDSVKPTVMRSVRKGLRAAGMHVDQLDLDAHYNRAWFDLYRVIGGGERICNLAGWLVVVVRFGISNEGRRFDEARVVTFADIGAVRGTGTYEASLADRLDQRALIQQWVTSIRSRLSDGERSSYVLRVYYGYSLAEIATTLGVPASKVEDLLYAARRKLEPLPARPERRDPGACQAQSLITALIAGVLVENSTRYRIATDHLRGCPTCAVAVRIASAENRDRAGPVRGGVEQHWRHPSHARMMSRVASPATRADAGRS